MGSDCKEQAWPKYIILEFASMDLGKPLQIEVLAEPPNYKSRASQLY